ncbi:diguanylate cyclase domain-containing protein [Magnetococcales bacterium HHB-1]
MDASQKKLPISSQQLRDALSQRMAAAFKMVAFDAEKTRWFRQPGFFDAAENVINDLIAPSDQQTLERKIQAASEQAWKQGITLQQAFTLIAEVQILIIDLLFKQNLGAQTQALLALLSQRILQICHMVSQSYFVSEQTAQRLQSPPERVTDFFLSKQRLHEQISKSCSLAKRYQEPVTLIFLRFNSMENQPATEYLFTALCRALQQTLRNEDSAGKIDESTVLLLLPKTGNAQALEYLPRLITAFKMERPTEATFSAGVAQTGPEAFDSTKVLLNKAERGLQTAMQHHHKQSGFFIHKV